MNFQELIDAQRLQLAQVEDEIRSHPASRRIDEIFDRCVAQGRDPSEAESSKVRSLQGQFSALTARASGIKAKIDEYKAQQAADEADDRGAREFTPAAQAPAYSDRSSNSARAYITGEPRTYAPHLDKTGERSFVVDAYRAQVQGDLGARTRLERHAVEVEREGLMSNRAVSTGGFAGLVVPQYLVDQAALIARAARPVANSVFSMQIPEQGMAFQIPKGTTGASAAIQATENTSVSNTDEVWTNVTVNVATIAGQADVSRQSIERGTPGIDALVYMDLAGAYGTALDQQVLSGSGSSGQMLGILNTAGTTAATAYGAAITPALFQRKVAGAINAIINGRFLGPTHIAMTPRRFAWLVSATDSQNRPLFTPNANGPVNVQGTFDAADYGVDVGSFMGLRVVVDASLPTAQGTLSEDVCLVYRAPDLILWEDGDGMPHELRFEQTLGNQLTIKLVSYGYAAFTAARYPLAVAITGGADTVAGNGQIAPAF